MKGVPCARFEAAAALLCIVKFETGLRRVSGSTVAVVAYLSVRPIPAGYTWVTVGSDECAVCVRSSDKLRTQYFIENVWKAGEEACASIMSNARAVCTL